MKNFSKKQKIAMAVMMALALVFALAIPAFAETQNAVAEPSGWNDPMFYIFMACVAGFFAVVVGATVLYFYVKRKKKEKEWEEDDGVTKLYDDLEDHMWEAPDSVFLDALEPTASILLDAQPVVKIPGLDGIIITEGNIDPIQAINMGHNNNNNKYNRRFK